MVYHLGLDWDDLPGQIKSRQAHPLILTMASMGQLELLIRELRQSRAALAWPDAPLIARQSELLRTAPVTAAVALGAAAAGLANRGSDSRPKIWRNYRLKSCVM